MGLAQKQSYYVGGNVVMKQEDVLYTIADVEALPDGERAELIDGRMYMMASPTAAHQRMLGFLYLRFGNYINSRNGGCEVFLSPFAVYLDERYNYVEPDLLIVCPGKESAGEASEGDENLKDKSIDDGSRVQGNWVDEKGCHGGPDLAIEIVSKSSRRMDYVIKLFKYRTYGVREYWIVDTDKRRIFVYDLNQEGMKEFTFEDKVPVGIYDGKLEIDFSEFPY